MNPTGKNQFDRPTYLHHGHRWRTTSSGRRIKQVFYTVSMRMRPGVTVTKRFDYGRVRTEEEALLAAAAFRDKLLAERAA